MARWHEIESALARWRAAEQCVACSGADATDAMRAAVEAARTAYHRVAAAQMRERLDELREADVSGAMLTPPIESDPPAIDGAGFEISEPRPSDASRATSSS